MNNRRGFLQWVAYSVGSLLSLLPIAARSATPSPSPQAKLEKVGTVADLDKKGSLSGKLASGDPFLVVKDPKDAKKLIAVNPVCTHAGCDVDWKADATAFACPCHGSQFKQDGSVAKGPAGKPLPVYTAAIDGDAVMVG